MKVIRFLLFTVAFGLIGCASKPQITSPGVLTGPVSKFQRIRIIFDSSLTMQMVNLGSTMVHVSHQLTETSKMLVQEFSRRNIDADGSVNDGFVQLARKVDKPEPRDRDHLVFIKMESASMLMRLTEFKGATVTWGFTVHPAIMGQVANYSTKPVYKEGFSLELTCTIQTSDKDCARRIVDHVISVLESHGFIEKLLDK